MLFLFPYFYAPISKGGSFTYRASFIVLPAAKTFTDLPLDKSLTDNGDLAPRGDPHRHRYFTYLN